MFRCIIPSDQYCKLEIVLTRPEYGTNNITWLVTSYYGVNEFGVTVCGVQHIL